MRRLNEFTAREWLELMPLRHAAKQLRNDAWLSLYLRSRPEGLGAFLESLRPLGGRSVAGIVAFEQPWALSWLLSCARRNVSDIALLVFDNSRDASSREEIARVCWENGFPYLGLPPNPTRHVNRSHGMAMSWIYENVFRVVEPRVFGFLDHDLIPVRKASLEDKISGQPLYGLANAGKFGFWSLWAGYSFFDFSSTDGKRLNFLYDFSRDLDTGGRNWNVLYRHLDRAALRFASFETADTTVAGAGRSRPVQFVDENWLHVGGVSYNDTLRERQEFFQRLLESYRASARP